MSVAAGRCGFVCVIALLHLLILGECYAVHINASSLYRKCTSQETTYTHTHGNNTIPYKFIAFSDIRKFEVGIRPYSFATAVFTSVLVAPDVSGHDHFGTLCTGSSHGKSVQVPIRLQLVTLHSVYDCLG